MGKAAADEFGGLVSRQQLRRFWIGLWAGNAFFLLTNLLLAAGWQPPLNTIARQLNLDTPASLGKWWLSAQLLLLSVVALYLYAAGQARTTGRLHRYGWPLFVALTSLMSADTVARMRQDVEGAFREALRSGQVAGVQVNWTYLFSPFILAAAVFLVRFAHRALGETPGARSLALAGIAAWAASIVLEVIECSLLFGKSVGLAVRAYEPTVEQMLEVGGTTLLLMAFVELGFRRPAGDLAPDASAAGDQSPA
ncbi:MAG: hypothetical protein GX774_10625 [Armatimonadetes bacterium]|jgi:hypothetical protein|nr:hypothetical protein [Armatimonadota bacterium]